MLLANQYSVEMARSNLSKEGRNLKRLTVSDKLAILDRLDRGERQCEIVKTTKLSQAVVSRIKKDGEKLRKIQKDNSPLLRSTYTLYKSKYPQVDQAVYDWFVDIRHQNGKGKLLPLTRRLIQSRAKLVADQFGIAHFNASNGWFARWLWRFRINLAETASTIHEGDRELNKQWPGMEEDASVIDAEDLVYVSCPPHLDSPTRTPASASILSEPAQILPTINACDITSPVPWHVKDCILKSITAIMDAATYSQNGSLIEIVSNFQSALRNELNINP